MTLYKFEFIGERGLFKQRRSNLVNEFKSIFRAQQHQLSETVRRRMSNLEGRVYQTLLAEIKALKFEKKDEEKYKIYTNLEGWYMFSIPVLKENSLKPGFTVRLYILKDTATVKNKMIGELDTATGYEQTEQWMQIVEGLKKLTADYKKMKWINAPLGVLEETSTTKGRKITRTGTSANVVGG